MKRLVLGGVKSGKSIFAERCASALSDKVCTIVTAEPLDAEMEARIARHKAQRPSHWQTVEAPLALPSVITEVSQRDDIGVVLVDCLTLWLTNHLCREQDAVKDSAVEVQIDELVDALDKCSKDIVLVSNETNMGVIPADAMSRRFCDLSGRMHQRLAEICSHADLVVAGIPMSLKSAATKREGTASGGGAA